MNVVLGELDTYFHRLPTDYVVRMVQPSSNPEVITIDWVRNKYFNEICILGLKNNDYIFKFCICMN